MIGDSWENLGTPGAAASAGRCGEYLGNGVVLVGATEAPDINGWFKSTNYGNTWTYKGQFPASVGANWVEDFESRGSGRVFVALGNAGLFIKESTDWGETWVQRFGSSKWCHVIETGGPNRMFASMSWGGIPTASLRGSEDDGLTWTYGTTPHANGLHSWTMLYVSGDIVLMGVNLFASSKIYRSTNNGKAGFWTEVKAFASVGVRGLCKGANGAIVCANLNRFWRSTDGGLTWSDQGAPGPLTAWIRDIVYCGGITFIAVGENGRAYRSIDNGVTWVDLGVITQDPANEHLYWVIYIPDSTPPCCLAGAATGSGNIYRTFAPPTPPPPEVKEPMPPKYRLEVGKYIIQCEADKQNLLECNFTLRQNGGCAEFDFAVGRPDFPNIALGDEVVIYLYGQATPWYRGRILERSRDGSSSRIRRYAGYGHFEFLNAGALVPTTEVFAGSLLRAAIVRVLTAYVHPQTGGRPTITAGKIANPAYTIQQMTFDWVKPIDAMIDLCELIPGYEYGVDEAGDFYFRLESSATLEHKWVGKHLATYFPTEDMRKLVNRWYLEGGLLVAGTNYDSFIENAAGPSQVAYGVRSDKATIPSGMNAADIQSWGANLLANSEFPKIKAVITGIDIERTQTRIWPSGQMRVTGEDRLLPTPDSFPIRTVTYHITPKGVTADIELGEKKASIKDSITTLSKQTKKEQEQLASDVAQLASGAAVIGIWDADHDTGIQVEEGADDDTIRFDIAGAEVLNATGTLWVFNEDGDDVDFRWEGDNEVNLLYLNAGTDRVGIGTATPTYELDVVGNIGLDEYLYHNIDPATYIRFTDGPEAITIVVGGDSMINIIEQALSTMVFNEGGIDIDFRWEGVGAPNALFIQGSDGKIGIGTAVIPHGGIGAAILALEGADSGVNGPHMQFTTATDDSPLLQILPFSHDSIQIFLDAYYDGAEKSSDVGSNYVIRKSADIFKVQYDSGNAQGAGIGGWNDGIELAIDGGIFFDNLLQQAFAGLVVEYDAATGELYAEPSAGRFKDDIRALDTDTSKLLDLIPKTYTCKETGKKGFGLIAEEVADIIPDVVVFDKNKEPLGIKYTSLSIALLNEVKRLNERLRVLEA